MRVSFFSFFQLSPLNAPWAEVERMLAILGDSADAVVSASGSSGN